MDKLSHWSLKLQLKAPQLTGLGMQRQRANSRIRSERVMRCSHGTPGQPPASLWGSRSPSSPRRRSSRRGSKEGRRGEEGDEGPTTGYRIDCLIFCLSRGRRNGNRSWGEMTWVAGKMKWFRIKEKKNTGGWSREWIKRKPRKYAVKWTDHWKKHWLKKKWNRKIDDYLLLVKIKLTSILKP